MKIIKTILLLIACSFLAPTVAAACSCVFLSPEELFQSADAVFIGKMINTQEGIVVEVEKSWKLVTARQVRIFLDKGSCGIGGSGQGERYLIYADKRRNDSESELMTDACYGTRPISEAGPRLDYLQNKRTLPLIEEVQASDDSKEHNSKKSILSAFAIVMVFGGVGLILTLLKYRAA